MRIILTKQWWRPGLTLSAGTVLDTDATHPMFSVTQEGADALIDEGMAEAVDVQAVEPHETLAPIVDDEAPTFARSQASVQDKPRRRGGWKRAGEGAQ